MKIDIKDIKKGDFLIITCNSNFRILEALEDSKLKKDKDLIYLPNFNTGKFEWTQKYKFLKCKIRYRVLNKYNCSHIREYVFPNEYSEDIIEETAFIDLNGKQILKYEV